MTSAVDGTVNIPKFSKLHVNDENTIKYMEKKGQWMIEIGW